MADLTFIYDGDCGFCKRWVERLRRRDVNHRIEFLAFQSEERQKRYPQILPEVFQKGGFVFYPDNRSYQGADAAPHLLRLLPAWKWMALFFKIPGVPFSARLIYGWIARNRRLLGHGTCSVGHC